MDIISIRLPDYVFNVTIQFVRLVKIFQLNVSLAIKIQLIILSCLKRKPVFPALPATNFIIWINHSVIIGV